MMNANTDSQPASASPFSKRLVLLVEDNAAFREAVAEALNSQDDLAVCGQAENAEQALAVIAMRKPDIVLVDISLAGKDGIELIREMRKRDPTLPAVVLTMHDPSVYAERAFEAGAKAYLTKQEPMSSVLATIRRVLSAA